MQKIIRSLTGPVARFAGIAGLIIAGLGYAFTEGGMAKQALRIIVGLAIVFNASTWGMSLFGASGGALGF